jgi:GntR family transcriptional regulator
MSKQFKLDQAIPPERVLSEIYGVNRLTVRKAVSQLVYEGLLRRQQGVGTFVAKAKITQVMPELLGFSDRISRAGHRPSSRIILFEEDASSSNTVSTQLRLKAGERVIKLVRLRLVDDEPFMLETTFLPQKLLPDFGKQNLEKQSLYQVLAEAYGIQIIEADEIIEPVALTDYEAGLLETEVDEPALLVEGTVYTNGRVPVEFTKSIVRGDKARYQFRIYRSDDTAISTHGVQWSQKPN